ncbi:MAG TPA: hypothetical protein VGH54_10250 [Mycobacterium sp.]|jgi:hypothetical protein|uniref:hypothetical protein n=1 Tax=Mycobacterium sp. TaxID=1785 RepID=UPI002F417D0F
MTWFNWYWAGFLLIGFGGVETVAIVTKHPEWTLSEAIWRWCNVLPGQTVWQWGTAHVLLTGFMIWLSVHLVFAIWR